MSKPLLSLLVAYWNRQHQLDVQLGWFARERAKFDSFEMILAERSPTNCRDRTLPNWVKRIRVRPSDENRFNKSELLNAAASKATGQLVMILDVDLLPNEGVLERHVHLASGNTSVLITGYRLDIASEEFDNELPSAEHLRERVRRSGTMALCPEDNGTALLKHLLDGHRFGVCPCLPRKLFMTIGGMDERFSGWGGEDEDLIERVCQSGRTVARCPELVYFHISHERSAGWNEEHLTQENRKLLRKKRWEREAE